MTADSIARTTTGLLPRHAPRARLPFVAFIASVPFVLFTAHLPAQPPTTPSDPRDADRARAEVVRAAANRAAPWIVTIETVGGAQPIDEKPTTRPTEEDDPSKKKGQPMPGEKPPPKQKPGRPPPSGQPMLRVADGPTTGLVWSADGWIISSSFNFVRKPTVTTVVIPDASGGSTRYVAKLVARDLIRRIALLKIDAESLAVPEWVPPAEVKPGQYAIACGRGFGDWLPGPKSDATAHHAIVPAKFPTVHVGIVSAAGRRNGNAIQTDAKTSPANYGGPLIDISGRVIGLIVPLAGAGEEMAGVEWYDGGIGFAVTRASIENSLERLKRGESIEPGKMGVQIMDAPDGRCRISGVADPSPALRAGIKPGDIVVSFNGQPVGDRAELLRRMSDQAAGENAVLAVLRDDKPLEFKFTLARPRDIGGVPEPEEDEEPSSQPSSQPSSEPSDVP